MALPAPVALWHAAQLAWNSPSPRGGRRWTRPAGSPARRRATRRRRPAPDLGVGELRPGARALPGRRQGHPAGCAGRSPRRLPRRRRGSGHVPALPAGPWHAAQFAGNRPRPASTTALSKGQPADGAPGSRSGGAGDIAQATPAAPSTTTSAARPARPSPRPPCRPRAGSRHLHRAATVAALPSSRWSMPGSRRRPPSSRRVRPARLLVGLGVGAAPWRAWLDRLILARPRSSR